MNLTLTGLVLGSIELNPAFYPTVEEYTAYYDPNEMTTIGTISATKYDANAYIGAPNVTATAVDFIGYREIGSSSDWGKVQKSLNPGTNPETSSATFQLQGKNWELQFVVHKDGISGGNTYKVFLYADG